MHKGKKMRYEIALSTSEDKSQWQITDDELRQFVWTLYKLGYSVYRGYDDEICFTITDEEVTDIKEK